MGKYGDILLNPKGAVAILTFINFLNYVDRGIIPGASTSLRGCLYDNQTCPTLGTNVSDPSKLVRAVPNVPCELYYGEYLR